MHTKSIKISARRYNPRARKKSSRAATICAPAKIPARRYNLRIR